MTDTKSNLKSKSVIAREDDGNIQITFDIPFPEIKKARDLALKEISKNAEVPGFRKGMAPVEKVMDITNQNALLEKTLSQILPGLLTEAIKEHNIKPIIYPKFEIIKAKDDEDWQIRAVTCESPDIDLGDYKKAVREALSSKKIWTPKSGESAKTTESSREENEQKALRALIDTIKVKIPKVLIQEEVDSRLSNLLSRIEKLGISLESYLASTGKTAENLRKEYEKQSEEGLSLDFILSEIASKENIVVDSGEIDSAIKAGSQNEGNIKDYDTPERRRFIESILKRKKALDFILTLN